MKSRNLRQFEEEQAAAESLRQQTQEELGKLVNSMVEPTEYPSNGSYRPDETDLFGDLHSERDWERSADEHDRFLGRSW